LFIRKAPACTVGDLAKALKNIFNSNVPEKIIGIRHGEKIYETLATRDELQRAEDMGDYYRIKLDDRSLNYLNYGKYSTEGSIEEGQLEDYTSQNTYRLNVKQAEEFLLSLPEIKAELSISASK
jgi:UDP-glucose 4-epimerase